MAVSLLSYYVLLGPATTTARRLPQQFYMTLILFLVNIVYYYCHIFYYYCQLLTAAA